MGITITHRLTRNLQGLEFWTVEWWEGDVCFVRSENENLLAAHHHGRQLCQRYLDAAPEQFDQVEALEHGLTLPLADDQCSQR